ncbi:MAG TPA: diaminopimelate decarboxylase [Thermoplasmata archaeon]|nr:diaminopimelate decarboxylase [Thermoplasmata archaeon]
MRATPAPDPLPPPPFERIRGELRVEDLSVSRLAEEFGTPFYLMSEARIRSNARRFLAAFRPLWPDYRLLYALKANPNPAVVRILASEGCGADCSSPAEIRISREAGVAPEDSLYTGAYPSEADLSTALEARVPINLDDPALLGRLLELGSPRALSFRLNPGRTASGPEGLRFAGRQAKFGVPLRAAVRGLADAQRAGIARLGLHTMPGSNVLDASHFGRVGAFLAQAIRAARSALGRDLDFLDAGGGFGVPYRPSEAPLDLVSAAERLTGALSAAWPSDARPRSLRLLNEPGRYLVADSTVLVTRVTHVKAGRPPFVGVDAGMHTLLRPALYGAYHAVHPVRRRPGPAVPIQLVGPVCENTDVLADRRRLPPLKVGDLVALGNVGAYGFSMASQYNTRPRPAEVLVHSGRAEAIRTAESFGDLVTRVVVPAHLGGGPGTPRSPEVAG